MGWGGVDGMGVYVLGWLAGCSRSRALFAHQRFTFRDGRGTVDRSSPVRVFALRLGALGVSPVPCSRRELVFTVCTTSTSRAFHQIVGCFHHCHAYDSSGEAKEASRGGA